MEPVCVGRANINTNHIHLQVSGIPLTWAGNSPFLRLQGQEPKAVSKTAEAHVGLRAHPPPPQEKEARGLQE